MPVEVELASTKEIEMNHPAVDEMTVGAVTGHQRIDDRPNKLIILKNAADTEHNQPYTLADKRRLNSILTTIFFPFF